MFLLEGLLVNAQHAYYVNSLDGNDNNSGTSSKKAWRTIDKLNHILFKPGDKILLKAGQTFEGNILLDSLDSGTADKPITITSYGKGQAIIKAGKSNGIAANDISYVSVSKLYLIGDGVDKNAGSGIHFFSDRNDHACKRIRIEDCIAQGFHDYGILFSCANEELVPGFDDVRITSCTALLNGEAGIGSYGGLKSFHHKNFYVGNCKAFLNKGILDKTENHSGNGIVMGDVENLLIERCEAYANGENNRSKGGGPVGIWMWMCKNGVIQHCESHHNRAGLLTDGGGFDIDGGSSNCIMQYNYSHDNEGAGFLLAEYGADLPFTNNTVRFNISENDARKNSYGGVTVWGVDSLHRVNDCYVYNNTIYLTDSNIVDGVPAAVALFGNNFKHVLIANNIVCASSLTSLLRTDSAVDTSIVYFAGNNYCGANWKPPGEGQETFNGIGTRISTAMPFNLNLKGSAKFHPGSAEALKKNGVDLEHAFGIDIGVKDFFGKDLHGPSQLVGAASQ